MDITTIHHRAYTLTAPKEPVCPIIFESPHDSSALPPGFSFECDTSYTNQHIDWKIGELFAPVAQSVEASFLRATLHRSYLDLNRTPRDMHPKFISGDISNAFNEKNWHAEHGQGFIRTLHNYKDQMRIAQNPTQEDIIERSKLYWKPYHTVLQQKIQQNMQSFGQSLHITCHSFPMRNMLEQEELKDYTFFLGTKDHQSASPEILSSISNYLQSQGYGVKENYVFKGVELVGRHGKPDQNKHSVQIEIVREAYMDVDTLELHDGYNKIQETMVGLAKHLTHGL